MSRLIVCLIELYPILNYILIALCNSNIKLHETYFQFLLIDTLNLSYAIVFGTQNNTLMKIFPFYFKYNDNNNTFLPKVEHS